MPLLNQKLKLLMKFLPIALALFLCACGGGGGKSAAPETPSPKQDHPGFTIESVTQNYQPTLKIQPTIQGKIGRISYQLADNAPTDVIQISADKQHLKILNTGDVDVIATDSGNNIYLPETQTFSIKIIKGKRSPLLTNDLNLSYVDGAHHQPTVSGTKGELHYELSPNQNIQVLTINSNGDFVINGSGSVQITVTDDGGRNYQPDSGQFMITVSPATTNYATYQQIENKPLIFGGTLLPLFTGTPTQEIVFSIAKNANKQVVQIHPTDGTMTIIGAGKTTISVNQIAPKHHTLVPIQHFNVHINKAENLTLQVDNITATYNAQAQGIIPITGLQGTSTFSLVEGQNNNVITITDAQKGTFSFEGIGQTQVHITDSGNDNYLSKTKTINVTVEPIISHSLQVLSIETNYQKNQIIDSPVIGANGQLNFTLSTTSPTGIISLNNDTGQMVVNKPGSVDIIVTDDGGAFWRPQRAQFTVTINKLNNTLFALKNTQINYQKNALFFPQFTHNQGTVSYVLDKSNDVLEQHNFSQALKIIGSGRGWITATDQGNDFYHSVTTRFSIDVIPLNSAFAISPINTHFVANKIISMPVSSVKGELQWQLKTGQADVVTLNPTDLTMTINNAGNVTYLVTDTGDVNHLPQTRELHITVNKATENESLALSNVLLSAVYSPTGQLSSPSITGRGVDSSVIYSTDPQINQVVTVNATTGELSIKGAGVATVTVQETSRNFESTTRSFTVNITKAQHPGINIDNGVQSVAFYPNRKITPPVITNTIGELNYQFNYATPKFAEINNKGIITLHRYPQSRENNYVSILVTDNGNQNYQPTTLSYTLNITEIETGSGEEDNIIFNGTTQQITSPIDIAANDINYFSASGGRNNAISKDENDELIGGYTTMILQVCKNISDLADCHLMTLRLQNTSNCSDGSQVAYPIASKTIAKCANLQSPINSVISLSFNKSDPFNANLTEQGQYRTASPIILTHHAKPYIAGGVVQGGNIQARAWWLVDVIIDVK